MGNNDNVLNEEILQNVCDICCKNVTDWNNHKSIVHRPWSVEMETEIYCPTCEIFFTNEQNYYNHTPCYYVENICPFCKMILPSSDHFKVHDFTWNKSSYQCNLCETDTRKFSTKQLNTHRKVNHKRLGVYQCIKCDLHFSTEMSLKLHLHEDHSGCACRANFCFCKSPMKLSKVTSDQNKRKHTAVGLIANEQEDYPLKFNRTKVICYERKLQQHSKLENNDKLMCSKMQCQE